MLFGKTSGKGTTVIRLTLHCPNSSLDLMMEFLGRSCQLHGSHDALQEKVLNFFEDILFVRDLASYFAKP